MDKKHKKPEIRFLEFNDNWRESKFSEIAVIKRGLTYKPSDINANGVRVLRSSNINEDTFVQNDDDVFVDENAVKIDFTREHDILITSANGSTRLVGKHAIIQNLNKNTVHGGFMLLATTKYPYFLNASMSSSWYKHFINLNVSGGNGAIGNLRKKDLEDQLVYIPKENEQLTIGVFFKNIDYLLNLNQKKYEQLRNVKKSMLEKLFPKEGANTPEVRFEGFSKPWKTWEIGNILSEKKRPINLLDDAKYELVTVKRRNEGIISRGYLKGKDILVKNYYEIKEGDYVISKRQVVHGANGVVPQKLDGSIVSNEYFVVTSNENITTNFLAILSKRPDMYKKFFLSSYGVDIEKLFFDIEDWKKRPIIVPSLSEQNKIVLFFRKIDDLINFHQRKIVKMRNIKIAFHKGMFV